MKSFSEYFGSRLIISAYNISRSNMPQINDINNFLIFLDKKNILYSKYFDYVDHFSPTQKDFDNNKVNEIIKSNSFKTPIIVSNDNYVVDGHHRYFAAFRINKKIDIIEVNMDINKLLNICFEYVESAL